jgi:hypothetical protein
MPLREIPREEWTAFFDSFSRQHAGWLSTVEVFRPSVGAQVEVREQPLGGISAELKGDKRDSISILVGNTSGARVTHMIDAPLHVRLKKNREGAHEALQIESESGVTTLLFRTTVPLEVLDGYIAS